ncbi:hypothetical protein BDZ94DRAFT_1306162 [Collybia nuda]|uniref:Uncharacterized protein n=1 Tax=Collybia nuda TaxID=64659 RepID=A0A9P6CN45_9AGAR|nr:hypothetical protein BDZ94DRAFT_1306162 [Collybia nuda]
MDYAMTPPPTQGTNSSNQKQKHSQDNLKEASTSSTKKVHTSKIQQPKKLKRPSDWHLRKTEIPDGAKETKLALELHIWVLWCLSNQNVIPPKVTNDIKAHFAK